MTVLMPLRKLHHCAPFPTLKRHMLGTSEIEDPMSHGQQDHGNFSAKQQTDGLAQRTGMAQTIIIHT